MYTQIQPTPVLYGKDAESVLEELDRKPTNRELEKMEERRKFFQKIAKRGLR